MGNIEIGETVKIATFSQDDSHMDLSMKAIDYVKEGGEWIPTEDGTKISASQLAERFLFDGTMQYYLINKEIKFLKEKEEQKIKDEPSKKKTYVRNKDERPKFTFKEQREFETIYSIIEEIENKISEIEEEMIKNSSSYGLLNELDQEKTKLEEELLEKYENLSYLF